MRSIAEPENNLDPERLRYLTRKFSGARGLNSVILGTIFLFFRVIYGFDVNSTIGKIFESSLKMVMLATAVYAIRHLPRYYEQRFGKVEQKSISNKQFIFLLGSLIVLLFIGQRLQWIADGALRHIHLLLSDPNGQVDIAPFLMWSLFFCLSIRWRMQKTDWPKTGISFIGALAYALLGLHLISHPDARQFVLWKILNAGAIGIFLITAGLYDHLLLVRSIPNKISEDDNE